MGTRHVTVWQYNTGTPVTGVCYDAINMWHDPVPRYLTGRPDRVLLEGGTVRDVYMALWNGTKWFRRLCSPDRVRLDGNGQRKPGTIGSNARILLRFLGGLPKYGPEEVREVLDRRVCSSSFRKAKSAFQTADSVLLKLSLTVSESWQNHDTFEGWTCQLISGLIRDQYLQDETKPSYFSRLKASFKLIHELGSREPIGFQETIRSLEEYNVLSRLFPWWEATVSSIRNDSLDEAMESAETLAALTGGPGGYRKFTYMDVAKLAIVTQARAGGAPPRCVERRVLEEHKADMKSAETETPMSRWVRANARDIVLTFASEGDPSTMGGRLESAIKEIKISISDKACLEAKAADGGKWEGARILLQKYPTPPRVDLHTGIPTGTAVGRNEPIGERVFYAALWDLTHGGVETAMTARVETVVDANKYRVMTIGSQKHAFVLQPAAKMASAVLRTVESEKAGFTKEDSGWEAYKSFPSGYSYVYSEDWSTATDKLLRSCAGPLWGAILSVCHLPRWYANVCVKLLTGLRKLVYPDGEVVYSTHGVLMGDPGTKVVLHLVHGASRVISGIIRDKLAEANVHGPWPARSDG